MDRNEILKAIENLADGMTKDEALQMAKDAIMVACLKGSPLAVLSRIIEELSFQHQMLHKQISSMIEYGNEIESLQSQLGKESIEVKTVPVRFARY
jgi:hypothetical protein